MCSWIVVRDWCNKSIALARESLNKPGLVCRIPQYFSQMVDRLIEPPVEVHEGARRPEPANQCFTRYQFARLFEQGEKKLKWLFT